MSSILDPNLVPGYKTNAGPPDDYEAPGQTFWTKNKQTNAKFGLAKMPNGRFRLRSTHRVRAMDLAGSRTVIPGEDFNTGRTEQFHLFFDNQLTTTIAAMPATIGDVTIDFRARADLSGAVYVNFSANGRFLGRVFRIGGNDAPSLSTDRIVVGPTQWNQLLDSESDDGSGDVTFSMEPISSFNVHTDWMTFQIEYTTTEAVAHKFVNEEVCFPHWANIERRGDGRFRPVAIYQPISEFPPVVARGFAWRIIDDPADRQMRFWNPRTPLPEIKAEWPELGRAGRFTFVLPFETPDSVEGVVASYPVVCGVPY